MSNPKMADIKKSLGDIKKFNPNLCTEDEAGEHICEMVDDAFEEIIYAIKSELMSAWLIADIATKQLKEGAEE